MREIIYRGKAVIDFEMEQVFEFWEREVLKNGDWIQGDLIWNNGTPFIVHGVIEANDEYISLEWWVPVAPETIGQYTGLTDKNCKKIFEGDIYRVINKGKTLETQFEIRFLHGAFCAAPVRRDDEDFVPLEWIGNEDEPDDSAYFFDYAAHGLQFEVIGNIYDNKELIENK